MLPSTNVLIVVTSAGIIDGQPVTGVWFEELAIPYQTLRTAQFTVTVASPKGGAAPIDPRSAPDDAMRARYGDAFDVLMQTVPLAEVDLTPFVAVLFPGGHGPMLDEATDEHVKATVRTFAQTNRVIGALCHGPAALLHVRMDDDTAFVAGRRMTSFTREEEAQDSLESAMPFSLQTELEQEGAHFIAGPFWSEHVEIDGLLVTGQNPPSSAVTAHAFVQVVQQHLGDGA